MSCICKREAGKKGRMMKTSGDPITSTEKD